jgi:hypothetical protein
MYPVRKKTKFLVDKEYFLNADTVLLIRKVLLISLPLDLLVPYLAIYADKQSLTYMLVSLLAISTLCTFRNLLLKTALKLFSFQAQAWGYRGNSRQKSEIWLIRNCSRNFIPYP